MNVLVALDGSPHATEVIRFLNAFPLPEETHFTCLTVIPPLRHAWMDLLMADETEGDSLSDSRTKQAQEALAKATVPLTVGDGQPELIVREGDAAEQILEAAKAHRSVLIVMGTQGKSSLERLLLGSVSQRVTRFASCSVLVVRPGGSASAPRPSDTAHKALRLLLAVDASPYAREAVNFIDGLSLKDRAQLALCHVVETASQAHDAAVYSMWLRFRSELRIQANATLSELAQSMEGGQIKPETILCEGEPAAEIVAAARQHKADLLVIGHKGESDVDSFPLGGLAAKLIHHTPCSILVVRKPENTAQHGR